MKYPGYRKMSLQELQHLQLETMKVLHSVCVKHGICYYMIAGTLLGAVRHKGFIPWDDDIDIALMRSEYEKLKKIILDEFDTSKYFLQDYSTDVDHRPALMRLCIKGTIQDLPYEYHLKNCKNTYIDIFPLDNIPDDSTLRSKHAKDNKLYSNLLITKLYIRPIKIKQLLHLKFLIFYILGKLCPLKILQKMKERCMRKYEHENTEYVCSMESHYSYERQSMPRSIYGIPKMLKFEDAEFYAPEHYIEYLKELYGTNYMTLPPEDKREKPYDVYIKV